MIVQRRLSEIRLITQHDHGLLSGELASRWRDPDSGDRLSSVLIVVAKLHDFAWEAIDDAIIHWCQRGLPADFTSYPEEEKLVVYQQGIEELSNIHPYAGLLLSRHYSAFSTEERAPMFTTRERIRRKRLTDECLNRGFDPSQIEADFELLKVLDVLSLLICVTPPGSLQEDWPVWLNPSPLLKKRGMSATWRGEALTLDPFPFDAPIESVIPYRLLPDEIDRAKPFHLDQLRRRLQPVRIEPT